MLESELLIRRDFGNWRLYAPAVDGTIGQSVNWRPRFANDPFPWIVVGTDQRLSSEGIDAEPPPDPGNWVCRTCHHALDHARGQWLHFDGECGDCTARHIADELQAL